MFSFILTKQQESREASSTADKVLSVLLFVIFKRWLKSERTLYNIALHF